MSLFLWLRNSNALGISYEYSKLFIVFQSISNPWDRRRSEKKLLYIILPIYVNFILNLNHRNGLHRFDGSETPMHWEYHRNITH